MAQVTYGVSTEKKTASVSTPIVAESGIHFVVGTAPVHTAGGKVNEVIKANSYKEALEELGYSDDWEKYGLCEEVYTAFKLYKVSPIFMVNVLDPRKHKTDVPGESMKPEGNQITLPFEAIAESVKITGKEKGTDFDVFYNENNCIVEFLGETPQAEAVTVEYSVVDPLKVTKDDIIGGCDVVTHEKTGLELIDNVFPKFTTVPDIILCPNYSHDPEVAAIMSAKAENINGVFEAVAILDVDASKESGVTYYGDVPEWKRNNGFTRGNEIVCFPKAALGDKVFHLSTQLAGAISATDNDEDLGGGTPCESASNKTIQADRMVAADGSEIIMDIQNANLLRENGIVTGLNFCDGFVSWGNYTACYPSNTNPESYFYNINRVFRWVAKSIILSYWSYIDRKMSRILIDAILQGINGWLNSMSADGKILGGRIEMFEDENPDSALAEGKIKYHLYLTPASPIQKIEFTLEYDLSYLTGTLSA